MNILFRRRTADTVMVSAILYLTSELPSVIIEKTGNTSTISFFVWEAILYV